MYYKRFFTDDLLRLVVDNTNLYSTQNLRKRISTIVDEKSTFIEMQVIMGLVKLPTFSDLWSNTMCYPTIADNMPRDTFKVLRQNLNFVDNSSFLEGCGQLLKFHQLQKLLETSV